MSEADDPETALRAARQQLIDRFPGVCDAVAQAIAAGPEALRSQYAPVHRLAGLAGIVGFPRVSERALDLQDALKQGAHPDAIRAALDALRGAFADDLAAPPPSWL